VKFKKFVLIGMLAAGIGVTGLAISQTHANEQQTDKILDNIYIGEVAVGGMGKQEAADAVNNYVDSLETSKFTLSVNSKSITATARELGVTWENTQIVEEALNIGKSGSLITRYKDKKDLEHEPKKLELSFKADESKIKNYLTEHEEQVNQEAVDGGLVRENGTFTITDGKEGIAVNIEQSAKTIADYIDQEWDAKPASIELTAKVVQPKGSREQLSRVRDVLGTFSTDYSSSNAGRAANVSNGCGKINGTLLYPGDKFSVYETVSPFTAENGYELAGSYENGTVVETYGGGICQVSTTLYNAVIRAELKVEERWAHSMIVNYVQPSMDAAIAGTYKDFKFTNSTDAPVFIEGVTSGGVITFTVYGEETRDANREVSFESEIVSETAPPVQVNATSQYPVGYVKTQQSTHVGKVAKLWKIVTVNGVEQSREVFNNSTYNASPKIIVVGTATNNPEAAAIINNAIATKNENTIYAAAANAAAVAAQPQEPEEPENPDESGENGENGDKPDDNKDKPDKTDKNDGKKPDKKDEPDKDNSGKDDSNKDQSNKGDSSDGNDKKDDSNKTESSEKKEAE